MVLEEPLYAVVRTLARREKISISQKARDLVRDGLELVEDLVLDRLARERAKTFRARDAIVHAEVRRRLKI